MILFFVGMLFGVIVGIGLVVLGSLYEVTR